MKKNRVKIFLQCLHILLSVFLIIISVLIFVSTFAMKSQFSPYSTYLSDYSSKPLLFLLVGSTLLMITGFVGIVCAIHDWIKGIITFMLFILYLLISMIALAITAYILSESVDERMYTKIKTDMSNYNSNENPIDNLQLKLSCCGVENSTEWTDLLGFIPGSCCNSEAFCDDSEISKLNSPGCYSSLKNFIKHFAELIFIVLVALGVIEIFSIIISIFYVWFLKYDSKKKMNHKNNSSEDDLRQLPRVHNPLGQNPIINKESTSFNEFNEPVYVRRPVERPIILAYKMPHENYLNRPPQYRFDSRRIGLNKKTLSPNVYDSSRYS